MQENQINGDQLIINQPQNLPIIIQQSLDLFPQSCHKLYKNLIEYINSSQALKSYPFPTLSFPIHRTQSNVCAKILKKVKAYKCFDCIYQNNSIMCIECFVQSQHQGHVFQLIDVHGGCCDCGDQEKWDAKGACKRHFDNTIFQQAITKVDNKENQQFTQQLSFCFFIFFSMYNEATSNLTKQKNHPSLQTRKKISQANHFGWSLLSWLQKYNSNSLISNILTYNMISCVQKLPSCQSLNISFPQSSILIMMLHLSGLIQVLQQKILNFFIQLFTIKQFRKKLTICFVHIYEKIPQFAMGEFGSLSCQLITSHKVITQLVQTQQISPLVYLPKHQDFNDFQTVAQNFVRYYVDINYLSKLYKQASQVYLQYHIMKGALPKLGYYRDLSIYYGQSISYYGIQQIYIGKVLLALKVLKQCPNNLKTLQKGIIDLCSYLQQTYHRNPIQINSYDDRTNYAYITQQLTLGLFLFTYKEILQEQGKLDQFQMRVVTILQTITPGKVGDFIRGILNRLNNSLVLGGLCMGHSQTMERFYTYFSFMFQKSMVILSTIMFLYKTCIKLTSQVNKSKKIQTQHQYLSSSIDFMLPLQQFQQMLKQSQFQSDQQSIFDRCKILIQLNSYLNLIIQICETDFYQLLIAVSLDYQQKYSEKLMQFYINILYYYGKVELKEFKLVCDSLFNANQVFQQFITHNNAIQIVKGKVSLKSNIQNKLKSENIIYLNNLLYFKSLKSKLIIPQNKIHQISLSRPLSENHLVTQLISPQLIQTLTNLLPIYSSLLFMSQQPIRSRECPNLGNLLIQTIKLIGSIQSTSSLFSLGYKSTIKSFYQYLLWIYQRKDYMLMFSDDVLRIVGHIVNKLNLNQIQNLQIQSHLKSQAQHKANTRKNKLIDKKNKKLAKFKQNQSKYQQQYSGQMLKIRQQMQAQQQQQALQCKQTTKSCLICRQSQTQNSLKSDLALMGFMQISNLYQYLFKQEIKQNELVFKSCGHYIHFSCHQKINNKNQLFSICQLCKGAYNCLFPIIVQDRNACNFNQIQQVKTNLHRIIALYSHNCNNITLDPFKKNSQSDGSAQSSAMIQKLKQSIIRLIVWYVVINYQHLQKLENRPKENYDCLNNTNKQLTKALQLPYDKKFLIKKQFQIYANIFKQISIMKMSEDLKQYQKIYNVQHDYRDFNSRLGSQGLTYNKILQNMAQNSILLNPNSIIGQLCYEFKDNGCLVIEAANIDHVQNVQSLNYQLEDNLNQQFKKQIQNKNKQQKTYLSYCCNQIIKIQTEDKHNKISQIHQQQIKTLLNQKRQFDQIIKQQTLQQIIFYMEVYLNIQFDNLFYGKVVVNQIQQIKQKVGYKNIHIIDGLFRLIAIGNTQTLQKELQNLQQQIKSLSQKQQKMMIEGQQQPLHLFRQFYVPPKNLKQVFQHHGKCPYCPIITNHLYICLICSFKTCKSCPVLSVTKHTQSHMGTSIYLATDTGQIYYVSRKKHWMYPSIYQNFMGVPFEEYTKGLKLDRFTINQTKLQDIYKSLLHSDVQTKIRYQQFNKKKTFSTVF